MSVGFLTRAGIKMEAQITTPTWPSAAAGTIASLLPIHAPTPDVHAVLAATPGTHGYGPATDLDRQTLPANLTLPLPVIYEGLEPLWACALGYMAKRYSGTVFPQTIVSGAYRHKYEVDSVLQADYWTTDDGWQADDGLVADQRKTRRFTTVATIGDVSAWEWLSCMVGQLSLSGGQNQALTATAQLLGGTLDTTPATNTLAAMQALGITYPARVLWHQGVTRIGAYSAVTPLGGGDIIKPSAWTMTLDNALETTYSARLALTPEEHSRGEQPPRITGTFTVPRHTADTLLDGQRAGTTYMADLIFTGAQIAATGQNYTLELYWPTIRFTQAGPVYSEAGIISQALSFEAISPTAAAAGMPATTHLTPFIVQLQSAISAHPLE